MLAHVTVAGCTEDGTDAVQHFRIEADEPPTGRMLAEALRSRGLRYALFADDLPLESLASLDSPTPLLLTPFARPRSDASRLPGLWLITRAGPDSGRTIPLSRGAYRIGRGTGDLPVLDPTISRAEATLSVGTSGIALTSGRGAESPVRLEEDFRLGATDLCVLTPSERVRPPLGCWPLPSEEIEEGAGRSRPWLMLTTAAAPVAIAIVLAVALDSWYFLAFSALGLLTGGVPAVAEIRRRRRLTGRLESAALRRAKALESACPPLGDLVLGVLAARDPERGTALGRGLLPAGTAEAPRTAGERRALVPLRLGTGRVRPVVRFHEGREPSALPTVAGPLILDLVPGSCGALPAAAGNAAVVRLLDMAARGDIVLWLSPNCGLPVELELVPGVRCGTPSVGAEQTEVWVVPESEHAAAAAGARPGSPAPDASSPGATVPPAIVVYDGVAHPGDTWRIAARSEGAAASVALTPGGNRHRDARARRPTGDPLQEHWLENAGERHLLRLDGAQVSTLRRFAAQLAQVSARRARTAILPESATWCPSEPRWTASAADSLRFALGRDLAGRLDIDLVVDGPHLLVAGTTGSGKSELLRTMIASLTHRYSPEELALVLVDFKGGATLGSFAREPHAHGLVTDLNEESAVPFLRSLRHELRRRERILGRLGVPAYSAARSAPPGRSGPEDFLPRLLVVVDEFRVLADEVPDAMPELLRIAAVGRSLGVHLVLATQRPQGVVTAEMRANINTILCLRVLGDFDAQDLVGTTAPARLASNRPGRGFLRRSGGEAIEFQAARLSDGSLDWSLTELGPTVGSTGRRSTHRGQRQMPAESSTRTVHPGSRAVPRLFSPELPLRLGPSDVPPEDRAADVVPIGLLDDVATLRHRPLRWSIGMRRLALVGGPQSGAEAALKHLVDQAARLHTEHHVYVLDGSGTMIDGLTDLPRVSGWACATDPHRLVEVLDVLDEARFSAPTLIVVSSLAGWSSALPVQQFARLDESLARLARSAEARNISLVVAGDRDLTASRFFALAEHRLLCPNGLGRETTMMWPRTVPVRAHPGRCVYTGPDVPPDGIAAQILAPDAGERADGTSDGCATADERSTSPLGAPPAALPQFRAVPLPTRVERSRRDRRVRRDEWDSSDGHLAGLPLGLRSPDGALWVWSPGRLGVILGPARSGKSTLLAAVSSLITAERPDLDVLQCFAGDGSAHDASSASSRTIGSDRDGGTPTPGGPRAPDVVLIDDATRIDQQARLRIERWFEAGSSIIMAARPGPQLYTDLPLAREARQSADGVLLNPRWPSDGEFWNWRLPTVSGGAPPGRGLVLVDGQLRSVQVFAG